MGMRIDNCRCPSDEIAAYIDGELSPKRELELDAHFVECSGCANELNQQKQFLCQLESSLKQGNDLELPADFTRTIVANAESTVSGLRRPRERFNALFICAGLFLFVLFASGADAARILRGVTVMFEQLMAVGGLFGRLIYSVFIGVSIVLRAFATQIRFDLATGVVLAAVSAAAIMYISRRVMRLRRA
jgi:anti-sigma factor RsiW